MANRNLKRALLEQTNVGPSGSTFSSVQRGQAVAPGEPQKQGGRKELPPHGCPLATDIQRQTVSGLRGAVHPSCLEAIEGPCPHEIIQPFGKPHVPSGLYHQVLGQ